MRVLVYEEWYLGHCFQYLQHILPRLISEVDEVVVAITPEGRESPEFASLLAPFADRVRFDAFMKPHDVYKKMPFRERMEVLGNLREAVRRARPDYVLSTTSDLLIKPMAIYQLMGRRPIPGGVPAEVCLHSTLRSPAATGLKGRFKDSTLVAALRHAAAKVHMVNARDYEWLREEGGSLGRRVSLLPHPVPPVPRLDKREARRRLGVPEDGRYMGLAALIDHRKAVAEMLAAFRAGAPRADDRLLRIILMDRFIEDVVADTVLQALDVVCIPYPGSLVLSSAMLHGVAAGRPVLVNDSGWMRMMIRRFGFGWTCEMNDHDSFTRGIRQALETGGEYVESEATRRLLAFHDPANFAACWVDGIRERMGKPPAERPTWPWVLEALDEEHRSGDGT
jgi:hypothetical protein